MSTATQPTLEIDRADIVVRRWDAVAPTHVVVLGQAYREHRGRYEHVAERLVADGAVVYAPEHRGHDEDTADVAARARDEHPGLPLVVVGPSVGDIIAARLDEVLDELAAFVDNATHEAV